ncbi:MAG: dihydrolipoyl dehydrogenase [Bacteroidetes bacterium]|nr:dihydrolipoyl dehydrogenase [Bacteroidota bacterium]
MNSFNVDLVVIGAGPGGYVAAIRAAQLGLKTICIEKEHLGGICLNWGCIPTKALLKSAEIYSNFQKASEFGLEVSDVKIDFPKIVQRSRSIANRMNQGIAFLFKKYGVEHIAGAGYIKSSDCVEVKDIAGNVISAIHTKNIVIATGSRPRMFAGIDVDRDKIITSKEAMMQDRIPDSLIVMGAGAIGVEFSYFYNVLGSNVTIIEMQDRILPIEDADVSKELERHYRKNKIKLLTGTKVLSASKVGDLAEVRIQKKDGSEEILTASLALNAIGIQANIENIGLENINVVDVKGFLPTDKDLLIAPNVYAIGDVAGAPWLAHKASAEGIAVAERIAGHQKEIDYMNIPGCTYCHPQVASVGITEAKAKEMNYDIRIGKFNFTATGKAHAIGDATGFVKLVIDNKTDLLLGAHLIGPDVTELLGELCLAKSNNIKVQQIHNTIHSHPTLSEAIMEAAAQSLGECVHC